MICKRWPETPAGKLADRSLPMVTMASKSRDVTVLDWVVPAPDGLLKEARVSNECPPR